MAAGLTPVFTPAGGSKRTSAWNPLASPPCAVRTVVTTSRKLAASPHLSCWLSLHFRSRSKEYFLMPCVCRTLEHSVPCTVASRPSLRDRVAAAHCRFLGTDARNESSFLWTSAMLTHSTHCQVDACAVTTGPAQVPGDLGCGIWRQGRT